MSKGELWFKSAGGWFGWGLEIGNLHTIVSTLDERA